MIILLIIITDEEDDHRRLHAGDALDGVDPAVQGHELEHGPHGGAEAVEAGGHLSESSVRGSPESEGRHVAR